MTTKSQKRKGDVKMILLAILLAILLGIGVYLFIVGATKWKDRSREDEEQLECMKQYCKKKKEDGQM